MTVRSAKPSSRCCESCLDCRELVLESLPRCCRTDRSETPAVVQFQRVAVAERDTGSRFEIFRLRPSLRIDRCPVTCLKVEIRAVRLEPGGLILGDESLPPRIRHRVGFGTRWSCRRRWVLLLR